MKGRSEGNAMDTASTFSGRLRTPGEGGGAGQEILLTKLHLNCLRILLWITLQLQDFILRHRRHPKLYSGSFVINI